MDVNTYKNLTQKYTILVFYFLVIMLTTTVGHIHDSSEGFSNGLYVGMIVSVLLWVFVGKNMAY